jgi:hypothetical protein
MKDKKVEAAIKQLYELLHPYMRGRKCSIIFSPEGDVDMGFVQSVKVKMKKPRVSVIHATEEQTNMIIKLIRNPKISQYLIDEYSCLIQQGRLSRKNAANLIQRCIDNLKQKNIHRNPNLKPLE